MAKPLLRPCSFWWRVSCCLVQAVTSVDSLRPLVEFMFFDAAGQEVPLEGGNTGRPPCHALSTLILG